MPGDVIGNVILVVYRFPHLIQNKTLNEVLTTIVSNSTILNHVAQATGVNSSQVTDAIRLYITVVTYLNPATTSSVETSNTTTPNNTLDFGCIPRGQGDFTTLCLVPSLLIIFILSFLAKRQRTKKCCGVFWNRPGLCIPLNLVDSYENRLAYACAFGATVYKCLNILLFSNYEEIFSYDFVQLQQDPTIPSWVGVFWKMLAMTIIGVAYYPLFACMSTDYQVLGGIIGFVYSTIWLIMTLVYAAQCPKYFVTSIYPGDNFALALPIYLCLFALVCMYFVIVVKGLVKFIRRCLRVQTDSYEIELWKETYKYKYVVKLLQAIPKESCQQNTINKVKSKIYRWKPEFKYSTRVVCTYVVCVLMVYQVGIGLVTLAGALYQFILILTANTNLGINRSLIKDWAFIGYVAWFVALGISSIYCIILVANMLSWYRGHLTRLQRGDKSFLPVQVLETSPSSITVATLKYSGYQVAYFAWSFLILHLLCFVIGTAIGIQIIEPMIHKSYNTYVWSKVKDIWPAILVSIVLFLVQFLLAKYVFLHYRGSALALENRRLFHICTYFLFFFNIFLGVVSCVKRILMGIIIGVMFLGRLQKSLLPRDFELKDPGFNAYVGYLYLEHTHSNPVLVTFCRMLILGLDGQNIRRPSRKIENDREAQKDSLTDIFEERRRKRIRNRWALFLTLSNNPDLKEERRPDKFVQKSPFQALGHLVDDYSTLLVQNAPRNDVGNENEVLGIQVERFSHDEKLAMTSKL